MSVLFEQKTDWDEAYRLRAEWEGVPTTRPEIRLGYNRCVLYPAMRIRAQAYIDQLGLTSSDKVLIVGCGFGWSMEHLIDLGIPDVWGTDPSPYIQANKALSERPDIEAATAAVGLNPYSGEGLGKVEQIGARFGFVRSLIPSRILAETCATAQSRKNISDAIGGNPDWIITEDVLPCLDDPQMRAFHGQVRALAHSHIAHLVTPLAHGSRQGANFNWKDLNDWKQEIGNDILLEAGSYRRIG